jgi:hypothetical protein
LQNDLRHHPRTCTVAYFHHSPFSSGPHGDQAQTLPLWQALYDGGADVVLTGHDHAYERFAPMDRNGQEQSDGMSLFVVGTGGAPLYSFPAVKPTSQVRQNTAHGVIKLTLHPRSFHWEFIPAAGAAWSDSGWRACR